MGSDDFFCRGGIEAKHDDMLILFGPLKHFLKWIVADKSPVFV